jgi:hypothetical protein
MADNIAGSLQMISFDGRMFVASADGDAPLDLGGNTVEQQMNGDGSDRAIVTRKGWMFGGITLNIDAAKGDLEFLQERQDTGKNFSFTATLASDVTYQGRGKITGDLQASTGNGTASVTFRGPDKLESQ